MPPKNLGKISKHITKKKGKNAVLHADSRDSRRLLRASARDDKLYKIDVANKRSHRPYINRTLYFQQLAHADPTTSTFDSTFVRTHIATWLARNTDELATLRAARRAGRPASKREEDIAQVLAHDEVEYGSGYWIPNMQDEESVRKLREWNGEWVGLGTMKWQRCHRDGGLVESSFPPRGDS